MKKPDINFLLRPNIRNLTAYEAREIPSKVKLDANESPYGFRIKQSVIKRISTNRYPDPNALALKSSLSKELKVKPENILTGNGSDELIYYLITTFGGPVLYPTPTFSMYGIISRALGEDTIKIPLDSSFDLDVNAMQGACKRDCPKLIFLSSPNNPTGNCFSKDKIIEIIKASKGLVIVDEAYQPFSSHKGFLPMLKGYKNLLIMKTLSKIGLAGLRVGFLIGDEAIIKEVNKVRLPFNLNSFSQAIATDVINDKKQMRLYKKSIVSERERLYREMKTINGIMPYPSEANFILFKVKNPNRIYMRLLRRKGILVRNMKGVVEGCLRVTVGTPTENTLFLNALKEAL